MKGLTRRQAMIGGGVAVAAGAGGGILALSADRADFYAALVRHYLRGEPLAPDAAEKFGRVYAAEGTENAEKVDRLVALYGVSGFAGLALALESQSPFETFVRRVATAFMLSSNMFERASDSDPIEFHALAQACGNPFARF